MADDNLSLTWVEGYTFWTTVPSPSALTGSGFSMDDHHIKPLTSPWGKKCGELTARGEYTYPRKKTFEFPGKPGRAIGIF